MSAFLNPGHIPIEIKEFKKIGSETTIYFTVNCNDLKKIEKVKTSDFEIVFENIGEKTVIYSDCCRVTGETRYVNSSRHSFYIKFRRKTYMIPIYYKKENSDFDIDEYGYVTLSNEELIKKIARQKIKEELSDPEVQSIFTMIDFIEEE